MTQNKLMELVVRIEQKTMSDTLAWEATADQNAFQTTLANYVVRIREHNELDEPEPDYEIKIIDKDGATLESISNVDLNNIYKIMEPQPKRHPYQMMVAIFKKAKRQVLGVDKAIDSILSELE